MDRGITHAWYEGAAQGGTRRFSPAYGKSTGRPPS